MMGSIVKLGVGMTVCAAMFGCDFVKQETRRYDGEGKFLRVEIINNVGDVTVRPSPDGQVHVESMLSWSQTEPSYTIDTDSNPAAPVLRIVGRCDNDERCMIDSILELPADVELVVTGGSGDISVEGTRAKIVATAEFGDISVADVGGDLELTTGSGDIEGRLLNSEHVTVVTDGADGRVDLEFDARPVLVDAKTVGGDIVYTVPAGPYVIDAVSKTGVLDIDVEIATGVSSKLVAYSVSGDITILPRCAEGTTCG